MLVYFEESFWQALEGEKTRILQLVENIKSDSRNYAFTLIQEGAIPEREYDGWSMGFKMVDAADVRTIDGFPNIQSVDDFIGISEIDGVAAHMLNQFHLRDLSPDL